MWLWSKNRALSGALASAPAAQASDGELEEPEGLRLGAVAPGFELPNVRGEMKTLEDFRSGGRSVLLVFFDPGCGPCHGLVSHVMRWQAALGERVAIAVISEGAVERVRALWSDQATHVLVDGERKVTRELYRVLTWPSAIAIGPDGQVVHELVYSQDAMEALLRGMLEDTIPSASPSASPQSAPPALSVTKVTPVADH